MCPGVRVNDLTSSHSFFSFPLFLILPPPPPSFILPAVLNPLFLLSPFTEIQSELITLSKSISCSG